MSSGLFRMVRSCLGSFEVSSGWFEMSSELFRTAWGCSGLFGASSGLFRIVRGEFEAY